MKELKAYALALAVMLFAAAMQWLSLAVFDSLAISFCLYTLLACLLLPAVDLLAIRKTPIKELPSALGFSPATGKQVAFALILGLSMDAIMFAAFFFLETVFMRESRAVEVVGRWGIGRGASALLYFAVLTLNGGVEELFWRGYVHRLLEDSRKRVLAVSLPAIVFGGQHIFVISRLVPNPPAIALFMAGIIGSGFLWGIIREKSKSLFVCVVCHMIVAAGYLSILGLYLFKS
jgi:membrane protease YdiL (CAAX protease family)